MPNVATNFDKGESRTSSKSNGVSGFDLTTVSLEGFEFPKTTSTSSTGAIIEPQFRRATAEDQARLITFFNSLPVSSLASRFFDSGKFGPAITQQATITDNHVILVAEILSPSTQNIVGVANCHRTGGVPLSGNIGVVITPEAEGVGLGYSLFRSGLQILKELGVEVLKTEYQGENRKVAKLSLRAYREHVLTELEHKTSRGFVSVNARL